MSRILCAVVFWLAAAVVAAEPAVVSLTPAVGGKLRVALVGDAGEKNVVKITAGLAAVHRETPFDAILLLGDNIYDCGVRSVDDPRWTVVTDHLSPLGIPIYAVLGNHDYGAPKVSGKGFTNCRGGNPQAQVDATGKIAQWNMPARNYRIHTSVADFAMIDTTPVSLGVNQPLFGSSTTSEIHTMIDQTFANTTGWRIVAGHHSIISSGYHGLFPRGELRNLRLLLPVLNRNRVDVYICGHEHHLELLARGRGDHRLLFIVSGAASRPKPPVRFHEGTLFPKHSRRMYGFAVLEITKDTLAVTFHDGKGRQLDRAAKFGKK